MQTKIHLNIPVWLVANAEEIRIVVYDKSNSAIFKSNIPISESDKIDVILPVEFHPQHADRFNIWTRSRKKWEIVLSGEPKITVLDSGETILKISDIPNTSIVINKVAQITQADAQFANEVLGQKVVLPTAPTLVQMAGSLGSSVAGWAKAGFAMASTETLDYRLKICRGCELWDQTGFGDTGKCAKCGCSTQAKLRMATSVCPLDPPKWEAQSVPEITTRAKIHAFIFNWKGNYENAVNLEKSFSRMVDKVTVINSDDNNKKDHWVNIGEEAYFGDQFKKALELFDGDIFFHTQADVTFNNWDIVLNAVKTNFNQYGYGVYAPNVDYTTWVSERVDKKNTNKQLEGTGLREVSMTDCSCWAINGRIINEFKTKYLNNLTLTKYGCGIDVSICALAMKNSMLVLRDYNFTVNHPKSTGYSRVEANTMMILYYDSLKDSDIYKNIQKINCR